MSIASELDRIKNTDIPALKSAITGKGGTLGITGRDIQDCATGVNSITVGGGGLTDAGTLNVTENGTYTPASGSGYSEVNVNVPTGGGETVIPTVYAKLERILIRTPADAVADYAGVWTRDSAWLDMATVPMTFQSGSFGWTGTRALARYTKTVNGSTVYLYLYYLDGYYYDDTTAWDAIGVANAQQFFDNIGTLGWSGEMYMNYCFSTTDYTPAQITNYNSVVGNTPFGTYSQAYAWTMPSPFNGPWDLLGLEDMGMGMGGDILQTYSGKSSASVTLAVDTNWDSFYDWNMLKRNTYPPLINNLNHGRLIDDDNISNRNYPGGDPITGTWEPYNDPSWPMNGLTKRYEWRNTTTGMYAAEGIAPYYAHGELMSAGGFMFMQRPIPHEMSFGTRGMDGAVGPNSWGGTWFPVYRVRSVSITASGTGYQVGDMIRLKWGKLFQEAADWNEDGNGNSYYYVNNDSVHFNIAVTSVDENGGITGITDLLYYNTGRMWIGMSGLEWWAWTYWLGNQHGEHGGVPLASLVPDWIITDSVNGTGFACELHGKVQGESPDYEPIFGGERVIYWASSYGDNTSGGYSSPLQFPKIRELYKLTTSLSVPEPESPNDFDTYVLFHFDTLRTGEYYTVTDSSGNNVQFYNSSLGVPIWSTLGKFGGCAQPSTQDFFLDSTTVAPLNIDSNPWTFEFWVKHVIAPSEEHAIFRNDWWELTNWGLHGTSTEHAGIDIDFSPIIEFGEYRHVAVCKDGDTLSCFVDGVAAGSQTSSVIGSAVGLGTATGWFLDNFRTGDAKPFKFDEFRITSGIRYTGNFTPPVFPFTA